MTATNIMNLSTARENLSEIVDRVFLYGETVTITKRNIPLVKVVRLDTKKNNRKSSKKIVTSSLFGMLKNDKRSALQIQKDWRKKAWGRI